MPPLQDDLIDQIKKKINIYKSTTKDGYGHIFFKLANKDLLRDIWNIDKMHKLKEKNLECRLIPLMKDFQLYIRLILQTNY